jgi:hypothetical protein
MYEFTQTFIAAAKRPAVFSMSYAWSEIRQACVTRSLPARDVTAVSLTVLLLVLCGMRLSLLAAVPGHRPAGVHEARRQEPCTYRTLGVPERRRLVKSYGAVWRCRATLHV